MSTYVPPLEAARGLAAIPTMPRGRTLIVGAVLAAAATVSALVLLFRPWPVRNSFLYEQLAPNRDGIWLAILIDSIAFSAVAIAISLAVCMLARTRGARIANVGAVLTILGGILFSMGAFAFAAFTWQVTDTAVLPAEAGSAVLAAAVANPEHLMLPQMLGFLLHMVGTVILAIALLRSGAVPRWLPVAYLVGTLAQFGFQDRALDFVQVGVMALLVVIAVVLVRSRDHATSEARSRG